MKTQLKAALLAATSLTLSLLLTACESGMQQSQADAVEAKQMDRQQVKATLAEVDSSSGSLTLKLVLDHRVGKDTLIELTRQQKEARQWKDKLVCFYYIGFPKEVAWASCMYLPKCANCQTDVDRDGSPIQVNYIGLSRQEVQALRAIARDTTPQKILIGSFIDDGWRSRLDFYELPAKQSALMVQLFQDGSKIIEPLQKAKVNGVPGYRFKDATGAKIAVKLSSSPPRASFFNAAGKNFHTVGVE